MRDVACLLAVSIISLITNSVPLERIYLWIDCNITWADADSYSGDY